MPKERKKLHNRLKMLKREKHRAYSKEKKKKLDKKILETEQKMIDHKRSERLENKRQCLECMKDNPRMFYSFINKQRNRRIKNTHYTKVREVIEKIQNYLKTVMKVT